jgi:hypothetical protein
MVRRSTFNRDGESSILSSSTKICRRPILLAGAICPVRPMDQDRTLRTFKFGFESRAGYQFYGVVAERQRRLTVYEDQVGSTPIHYAKSDPITMQGSS